MQGEFAARDTVIVAVSQEDKDLESFAKMPSNPKLKDREFEIVADIGHTVPQIDRVTTYLIDKDGVVREVFPQLIRHRATWSAVLHAVDEVNSAE